MPNYDTKIIIVHPLKKYVDNFEYNARNAAIHNDYPLGILEKEYDSIFSKFRGCERAIILPSESEKIESPDKSLLTERLEPSRNDVILSDFNPYKKLKSYNYPDWSAVLKNVEDNLDLNKNDVLIIGGFMLHDCVEKFAWRTKKYGYEVFIDEMITEIFYSRLVQKILNNDLFVNSPTFYRIEDKEKIIENRLSKIFS